MYLEKSILGDNNLSNNNDQNNIPKNSIKIERFYCI